MSDLEILAQEKNYREYLLHALDIRPSKRSKQWREMTTTMAELFFLEISKLEYIERPLFLYAEELFTWPILRSNEFIQRDRGKIGIRYFSICFKKLTAKDQCLSELLVFWKQFPQGVELGPALARLLNTYEMQNKVNIWPFYAPIAKSKHGEFYCRDRAFTQEALNFLVSAKMTRLRSKELAETLNDQFHKNCWQQLALRIIAGLNSSHYQKWIPYIPAVLAKPTEALKQEQEDLILGLYFLDGQAPGETLNLAWSRLVELGQNYERRSKLLATLMKYEILPGNVFSLKRDDRKMVLLDHLHNNFPEYMDKYAKTCLSYLSAQVEFPNGNPTINCHDLFSAGHKKSWLPVNLTLEYKKVASFLPSVKN